MSPTVSVIIVCMNRLDNLYPCLESIRRYTSVSYEVILTAYMFERANLERLRLDFPEVKVVESNELRGFSENNNLALRRARGKYCFVVNDDTYFVEPVIDALVEDFERASGEGEQPVAVRRIFCFLTGGCRRAEGVNLEWGRICFIVCIFWMRRKGVSTRCRRACFVRIILMERLF